MPIFPGLVVSELSVQYPRAAKKAVDGVSFRLPAGEVLAILGPSGCGKSSLLRAIAGLEDAAATELAWQGISLATVPVHKRNFGLLFQDGQLFNHRSVAGNVEYGLISQRMGKQERKQRVAKLLAMVGLPDAGPRSVTTLSGGEKQRVALARALAPKPQLLLLDEPLSALDQVLRQQLATELRELVKETSTTAIFVTHDQAEAFAVADQTAVMFAGKIAQVGSESELRSQPASAEVTNFLASSS